MEPANPEPLKIDAKQIEQFLLKNLDFTVCVLGLLTLISTKDTRSPWLKDCAPIHPRTAGPWRGKGSFGHGFGPHKVAHK